MPKPLKPEQSKSVWLGYDPREAEAFAVAKHSIHRHSPGLTVRGICLDAMRSQGLYWRPTLRKPTPTPGVWQLWDKISEAPMSTEFAISRFLTPTLAKAGWALFADCDVLARADLNDIFALADPKYAVMCVQHDYVPQGTIKMDGQQQTQYARKNWSSVVLFNCDHPANARLTVRLINDVPGRDLHRFCWLSDREIGELPQEFNHLVGVSNGDKQPKVCHFTNGGPWHEGYEFVPYAKEWRQERDLWLGATVLKAV